MCFCTNIQVERVEVKDVSLPVQLQRAMAAEAEASREARAKVVAAEGEQKASRALKEASDIISASASAMQLRYGYCYKKYSFLVFFAVCPKRCLLFPPQGLNVLLSNTMNTVLQAKGDIGFLLYFDT